MAQHATTPQGSGEMTAKTKKLVDGVRKPFLTFVKDFSALAEKRETLAPKFMQAANKWMVDVGGTFIGFVRFLDPSVPTQSRTNAQGPGYRDSRTYQAADYLRRLVAQMERASAAGASGAAGGRSARDSATAPATPMIGMARLFASIQHFIPDDVRATLTKALHDELHWNDRQVLRLEQLAKETAPLVVPQLPKGVKIPAMKLRIEHADVENVAAADRVAS